MPKVIFTQPFLVNAALAAQCGDRVVVLDLALNGGSPQGKGTMQEQYEATSVAFINSLGPRLVAWIDHHDHQHQADFSGDPRFHFFAREHAPACPPVITPELVNAIGVFDTITAHGDLDGIYSAIKLLCGGNTPYPEFDADSIAADSRVGSLSLTGQRYEAALKSNLSDDSIRQAIVAELTWKVGDNDNDHTKATQVIDSAVAAYTAIQDETTRLSKLFSVNGNIAWQDATEAKSYDLTQLLLAGQKQAQVALVRNQQGSKAQITIAGPRGWNFIELFGLAGGMPNRVNLPDQLINPLIEKINSL